MGLTRSVHHAEFCADWLRYAQKLSYARLVIPTLAWRDGEFLKRGVPHRILSGSIHYFRIHPDLWEDRLRRVAATGLDRKSVV